MNPQTQQKAHAGAEEIPMPVRIKSVKFRSAISFAGTIESAASDTAGMAAAHKGIIIEPAAIRGSSCIATKGDERADGVRLSKPYVDRSGSKAITRMEVAFVPWANIGEVRYGE